MNIESIFTSINAVAQADKLIMDATTALTVRELEYIQDRATLFFDLYYQEIKNDVDMVANVVAKRKATLEFISNRISNLKKYPAVEEAVVAEATRLLTKNEFGSDGIRPGLKTIDINNPNAPFERIWTGDRWIREDDVAIISILKALRHAETLDGRLLILDTVRAMVVGEEEIKKNKKDLQKENK